MIEQIKQALEKATHGAEWTNFDGRDQSKVVYEYDRLTEDTCAIIAECLTVEMAQFVADVPEYLRYLIGEVERLKEIDERESLITINIRNENKELQKALGAIATGYIVDCAKFASKTLQSIQGGNTNDTV
jgi:hypothetical protein